MVIVRRDERRLGRREGEVTLHRPQDLTRGRRRRRGAGGSSRSRHGRLGDGSGEMRVEERKERLLGFGEIGEDRRREREGFGGK